MSFVYAVNASEFLIMSDTKIGLNDRLNNTWVSEESRKIVKQMGLIKSVIVSPNIVVCYAGNNIDLAAGLLRQIKIMKYSLEDIIDKAWQIHYSSKQDEIEFIIGYCDNKKTELILIKNKQKIRDCKIAWIGSLDAYYEFKTMEDKLPDDYEQMYQGLSKEISQILKIENIYKKIVDSEVDPTVGGIAVRIQISKDKGIFKYMGGIRCITSSWSQKVESGETLEFYQGAEKGSYCCNIYESNKNFCCYICEDKLGIIYTDEVTYNESLAGMKFPKLYPNITKKEFDFIASNNGAYSCVDLFLG